MQAVVAPIHWVRQRSGGFPGLVDGQKVDKMALARGATQGGRDKNTPPGLVPFVGRDRRNLLSLGVSGHIIAPLGP